MSKGDNLKAILNKVKVLRLIENEDCKTDIDIFYRITPTWLHDREGGIFIHPIERGKIYDQIENQLKAYHKTGFLILNINEKNVFHVKMTEKGRQFILSFRTTDEEIERQARKTVSDERQNRRTTNPSKAPSRMSIDESLEEDIPSEF